MSCCPPPPASAERERQKQARKVQRPDLLFQDDHPQLSSRALAARNVRRVLKHTFPGRKFRVFVARDFPGDPLEIEWIDLEQDPEADRALRAQLRDLVGPFAHGQHDSRSGGYVRHQGSLAGFNDAFGGVHAIYYSGRRPTPAELSAMEAKRLDRALPNTHKPRATQGLRL